uniref:Amiloride-sensitive sodium channel n=1 Tax=Thelazia callipaeda TaxID=103827 RepID=A0A0N5D3W6_THECL
LTIIVKAQSLFSSPKKKRCRCHENHYPPFTTEIHGLSQALAEQSFKMRLFWIFVMVICISCGTVTTILVIIEYIEGPTATSITIRLVDSMEFPAITICPKIPDAFHTKSLVNYIRTAIPKLSIDESLDLLRFWIAGMGFANMNKVSRFNKTYLYTLNKYLKIWMHGTTLEQFFAMIQDKHGLKCTDFFYHCELSGHVQDCCTALFVSKTVMRRGICYQSKSINQVCEIGRLILNMKSIASATSDLYEFSQPLLIVYVHDQHQDIADFPNFHILGNQWNKVKLSARLVELLEQKDVCTNEINWKDYECYIRRWLISNIIQRYNCTLFSIKVSKIPDVKCLPGCHRWEYRAILQQSKTLKPFQNFEFNLEVSFMDLQYEHVKEVRTTSFSGFMSKIGGQFGFFLGLSIITFIQIILYGVHFCFKQIYGRIHRHFCSTLGTINPIS